MKPIVRALGAAAAVALTATLLAPAAQGAVPASQAAEIRPLIEDAGDWADQTVTLPAHTPLPDSATAPGTGSRILISLPDGTYSCSVNFVWTDGTKTYLGSAGHCFLPSGATSTHGPDADFNRFHADVLVCVANCVAGSRLSGTMPGMYMPLGPVAYARQNTGGEQVGHDFGIVEVPAALVPSVRPSMPMWGGPQGVETNSAMKTVCHYGHGRYVGESYVSKGRAGVGMGGNAKQFSAHIAIGPGDSGSPLEVCESHDGGMHGTRAVGVITHGQVDPALGAPLGKGLGTTIARAIEMAQEAGISLTLVEGA